MASYKIEKSQVTVGEQGATLLKVGFADPAGNDRIVQDATARLIELEAEGLNGPLVLVNGPASLPVGVVLAHHLVHRFGAVGIFDPKLAGYVISAAHGGTYSVGDVIPAGEVK